MANFIPLSAQVYQQIPIVYNNTYHTNSNIYTVPQQSRNIYSQPIQQPSLYQQSQFNQTFPKKKDDVSSQQSSTHIKQKKSASGNINISSETFNKKLDYEPRSSNRKPFVKKHNDQMVENIIAKYIGHSDSFQRSQKSLQSLPNENNPNNGSLLSSDSRHYQTDRSSPSQKLSQQSPHKKSQKITTIFDTIDNTYKPSADLPLQIQTLHQSIFEQYQPQQHHTAENLVSSDDQQYNFEGLKRDPNLENVLNTSHRDSQINVESSIALASVQRIKDEIYKVKSELQYYRDRSEKIRNQLQITPTSTAKKNIKNLNSGQQVNPTNELDYFQTVQTVNSFTGGDSGQKIFMDEDNSKDDIMKNVSGLFNKSQNKIHQIAEQCQPFINQQYITEYTSSNSNFEAVQAQFEVESKHQQNLMQQEYQQQDEDQVHQQYCRNPEIEIQQLQNPQGQFTEFDQQQQELNSQQFKKLSVINEEIDDSERVENSQRNSGSQSDRQGSQQELINKAIKQQQLNKQLLQIYQLGQAHGNQPKNKQDEVIEQNNNNNDIEIYEPSEQLQLKERYFSQDQNFNEENQIQSIKKVDKEIEEEDYQYYSPIQRSSFNQPSPLSEKRVQDINAFQLAQNLSDQFNNINLGFQQSLFSNNINNNPIDQQAQAMQINESPKIDQPELTSEQIQSQNVFQQNINSNNGVEDCSLIPETQGQYQQNDQSYQKSLNYNYTKASQHQQSQQNNQNIHQNNSSSMDLQAKLNQINEKINQSKKDNSQNEMNHNNSREKQQLENQKLSTSLNGSGGVAGCGFNYEDFAKFDQNDDHVNNNNSNQFTVEQQNSFMKNQYFNANEIFNEKQFFAQNEGISNILQNSSPNKSNNNYNDAINVNNQIIQNQLNPFLADSSGEGMKFDQAAASYSEQKLQNQPLQYDIFKEFEQKFQETSEAIHQNSQNQHNLQIEENSMNLSQQKQANNSCLNNENNPFCSINKEDEQKQINQFDDFLNFEQQIEYLKQSANKQVEDQNQEQNVINQSHDNQKLDQEINTQIFPIQQIQIKPITTPQKQIVQDNINSNSQILQGQIPKSEEEFKQPVQQQILNQEQDIPNSQQQPKVIEDQIVQTQKTIQESILLNDCLNQQQILPKLNNDNKNQSSQKQKLEKPKQNVESKKINMKKIFEIFEEKAIQPMISKSNLIRNIIITILSLIILNNIIAFFY